MKKLSWAALVVALAMVAGACGGSSGTAPDEDGNLRIELSEFQFDPDSVVLEIGQTVTLVLKNVGDKEHEFMIGRDVKTTDGAPDGFEHDFFEALDTAVSPPDALMGMDDEMDMTGTTMAMDMGDDDDMDEEEHGGHGFMVMRDPGESAEVTFTVTADQVGEWQIGCFEDDGAHWDDGMQGTLVVEEA